MWRRRTPPRARRDRTRMCHYGTCRGGSCERKRTTCHQGVVKRRGRMGVGGHVSPRGGRKERAGVAPILGTPRGGRKERAGGAPILGTRGDLARVSCPSICAVARAVEAVPVAAAVLGARTVGAVHSCVSRLAHTRVAAITCAVAGARVSLAVRVGDHARADLLRAVDARVAHGARAHAVDACSREGACARVTTEPSHAPAP